MNKWKNVLYEQVEVLAKGDLFGNTKGKSLEQQN